MTNYNKRLDEVLKTSHHRIRTRILRDAEIYQSHILQSEYEAKQALTSLIKELVAEAKRIAVEEVLDRFQKDCELNYTTWGNSERMLQVSGVLKRIEAERNKLKESK